MILLTVILTLSICLTVTVALTLLHRIDEVVNIYTIDFLVLTLAIALIVVAGFAVDAEMNHVSAKPPTTAEKAQ